MLLVKFRKDWADEFDVYGFALLTQTQWDVIKESLPTLGWGFGTNEEWEAGEIGESDFEVDTISHSDADAITVAFGTKWGVFPGVYNV